MKPTSKIKINDILLVEYHDINHNIKHYLLEDGTIIKSINEINNVYVLDEVSNIWNSFSIKKKRWKDYIFKDYICRSRSMTGKNTWSKGRIPPNKGLTNKEFFGEEKTRDISNKLSDKSRNYFIDDKYIESRKKRSDKISKSLKGRKRDWYTSGFSGHNHTEKAKTNMGEKIRENYKNDPLLRKKTSHYGAEHGMYGKAHSEESKKLMSIKLKEKYRSDYEYREKARLAGCKSQLSQNRKKPNTEILVENFLNENNIKYIPQFQIDFYVYDLYIPKLNILIEVQGDYWHGNPKFYKEEELPEHQKEKKIRDRQRKTFAENRGYSLIEIWENDIKNNNFSILKGIME